jgi:hypothetical protein
MYTPLIISAFVLASCFAPSPNSPAQSSRTAPAYAPPDSAGDPFPMPKEGLSIKVGPDGEMKLDALLNEFSRVSGQVLLIGKDVKGILQNTSTGLNRGIEVPAQEVYPVVEAILVQNDLMLVPRSDREPRLLAVESVVANRRGELLEGVIHVSEGQVSAWARHPAFLVTTVIDLPNTDVRTLSNSMRAMLSDKSTQLIIPVGNSNSLIITANGAMLASIVRMLRTVDDLARAEAAKRPVQPKTAPKESGAKDPQAKEAPPKD